MKHFWLLYFLLISNYSLFAQEDLDQFLLKNNNDFFAETYEHKLFDSNFFNSQYIFFGAAQGFSTTHEADETLFQSLYSKGFHYYIAEIDLIKSERLNEYFQKGDEQILNHDIFRSWIADTSIMASKAAFEKFQHFKDFYQSGNHFEIIGISPVQNYIEAEEYLTLLSYESLDLQNLDEYKLLKQALFKEDESKAKRSASQLLALITQGDKFYKSKIANYLKDKELKELKVLLYNLSLGKDENAEQEMKMLIYYQKLYSLNSKKFYGFLNAKLVTQTGYDNRESFTQLLQQQSKTKITSIMSFYTDAVMTLPYKGELRSAIPIDIAMQMGQGFPAFEGNQKYLPMFFSNNRNSPILNKVEYIEKLEQYSEPLHTRIFKLTGPNSPFQHSKIFAEITGKAGHVLSNSNNVTTQAFQYIVLFKNAQPALPLDLKQ